MKGPILERPTLHAHAITATDDLFTYAAPSGHENTLAGVPAVGKEPDTGALWRETEFREKEARVGGWE